MTAAARRILTEGSIALAHVEGGFARHGEALIATSPTRSQSALVRVTHPHFYDAEGARYRD